MVQPVNKEHLVLNIRLTRVIYGTHTLTQVYDVQYGLLQWAVF